MCQNVKLLFQIIATRLISQVGSRSFFSVDNTDDCYYGRTHTLRLLSRRRHRFQTCNYYHQYYYYGHNNNYFRCDGFAFSELSAYWRSGWKTKKKKKNTTTNKPTTILGVLRASTISTCHRFHACKTRYRVYRIQWARLFSAKNLFSLFR